MDSARHPRPVTPTRSCRDQMENLRFVKDLCGSILLMSFFDQIRETTAASGRRTPVSVFQRRPPGDVSHGLWVGPLRSRGKRGRRGGVQDLAAADHVRFREVQVSGTRSLQRVTRRGHSSVGSSLAFPAVKCSRQDFDSSAPAPSRPQLAPGRRLSGARSRTLPRPHLRRYPCFGFELYIEAFRVRRAFGQMPSSSFTLSAV